MSNQQIWVCEECGSEEFWQPAWISGNYDSNGKTIIGGRIAGTEDWCDDCDNETQSIDKEQYDNKEDE